MALLIAVVALVVALGGAVLAALAWRAATRPPERTADADLPADVEVLRDEVVALRADAGQVLRHLAVVRYDAFGDMGGQQSWSIALLDDVGDGVVLTAVHGRNDARTYAKNVTAGTSDQQLSPEEAEAVRTAIPGAGRH
ncbi:DUF4446 family protein [Solicola sp. PLA-1-18]|uniref:DUF4446 family protein n=1 Tax=Solicola sp. PLA-1-18 TaxID=3380532 RepID=UPI003B7EBB84